MRFLPICILSLLLAAGGGIGGVSGWAQAPAVDPVFNQDPHSSRGFGTEAARVDSQVTLSIPLEKAEQVYAYVRRTYAESNDRLRTQFPELQIEGDKRIDVSEFTDVYFDTPELSLFGTQNTVRFRTRVNTTDPSDRKSGRQLVQIKVTPPDNFQLRTELKFEVKPSTKYRDPTDTHPLFRLVDRSQRADLLNAIRLMGIRPFDLRQSITLRQIRRRVYLNLNHQNFLSFSVDEYRSRVLTATASFASVDVGLAENVYTESNPAKRQQLWAIRSFVVADLQKAFPDLTVNTTEKYSLTLGQLLDKVPGLRFLMRHRPL
jgi:hypothetical protein